MDDHFDFDVFLSHSSRDKPTVCALAERLRGDGLRIWLDIWEIRPGDMVGLRIEEGLERSRILVLAMSANSLGSDWVSLERHTSMFRDPTNTDRRFIPILLDDCEIPDILRQFLYVDWRTPSDESYQQLLSACRRQDGPPHAAVDVTPNAPSTPAPVKPRVFQVSVPRNPTFTGRAGLLARMERELAVGQSAGVAQASPRLPIAVVGLGGVGKTQLAVEYAYQHAGDFDVIWWIRAEQAETIDADYAALAEELRLPEAKAQERSLAVRAAKTYLASHSCWLLVLDNAESLDSALAALPHGADPRSLPTCGHVLITTRDQTHSRRAHTLLLDTWSRPESLSFLRDRMNMGGLEYTFDSSDLDALASALGDLPLALEQAGAYVDVTGRPPSSFLALFRERSLAALGSHSPDDYHATITTTWSIAIEQAGRTPHAADLLDMCAWLAPDDIPIALFTEWSGTFDDLLLDEAVVALRRYSLVSATTDDGLSVHRLVQAVIRDRQHANGTADSSLGRVLSMLRKAIPEDVRTNVAAWPIYTRLQPHAMAAVDHREDKSGPEPAAAGYILDRAATYMHVRAEFGEARHLFERAIRVQEAALGPDTPDGASFINNLGGVLQDMGDLAGAGDSFLRALKINEAFYGPDHPEVATNICNLGTVLRARGDLAGARTAFERSLAIDEGVYGPVHPNVAVRLNNLGNVLRDLGDLAGARAALERSLKIDEAVYGPNHPEIATDINNLGHVLEVLGDLRGAREAFERAIRIDEASYGPEHPNVARDVSNLAGVLRASRDLANARTSFERAVRIFSRFLGDANPNTQSARESLETVEAELYAGDQPLRIVPSSAPTRLVST